MTQYRVVGGGGGGWIPSMLDGWHPGMEDRPGYVTIKQHRQDNDMAFTNPAAAEIAKEILDERTKGDLREVVQRAVDDLTALIAGADCGSTLTFVKHDEKGGHFYYACVKSGNKWYTTAQNPRVIESDEKLIEWLIGLEIYGDAQLAVAAPAFSLPHVIEATATESE